MNDERPLINISRCDLCTERHCNGCKDGSHFTLNLKLNVQHEEQDGYINYDPRWRSPWIDNVDPRGASITINTPPPVERIEFPDNYTVWGQRTLRQNGSDNEE